MLTIDGHKWWFSRGRGCLPADYKKKRSRSTENFWKSALPHRANGCAATAIERYLCALLGVEQNKINYFLLQFMHLALRAKVVHMFGAENVTFIGEKLIIARCTSFANLFIKHFEFFRVADMNHGIPLFSSCSRRISSGRCS